MRNKIFTRIIITTLLVTLLTFNVGRVTRVSAMATTAAIVGAALLGTGAVYLGYLAMTGATISIPSGTGADIEDYLRDVGRKVAYYGSGAAIYNKIYSFLRGQSVNALNEYVVTWSQSDLLDLYNDFKDIGINQSIASFSIVEDLNTVALNGFTYSGIAKSPTQVMYNNTLHDFSDYPDAYAFSGPLLILYTTDGLCYSFNHVDMNYSQYRNYRLADGTYKGQYYDNGSWHNIITYYYGGMLDSSTYWYSSNVASIAMDYFSTQGAKPRINITSALYPPFPQEVIYDSVTDETSDLIVVEPTDIITNPNYSNNSDDDNNSYPVVPYVQLPDGGNWGFNLGDLLTEIINRGSQVITAVGIGDLINQFMNSLGGDTGDYIYYSDNDNNYYIYYSNVYQGDDYTTYNINVGDQQEVVPLDLNTIQQYTDNVYLDVVRERVDAFSDTVGSFVAFWHNIDYEIVYAVFGSALIVLLGAFIGKWGHS